MPMDIYSRQLQNKYKCIFELEPRDWIDAIHDYRTTNYLQFLLTTAKYNDHLLLYVTRRIAFQRQTMKTLGDRSNKCVKTEPFFIGFAHFA